ncbi:MAG TPA: DUF695 domain-containing protein [Alphaproteobacteria bacterium]|nr:DUF695 domain-containing protein [Alphaproteobacteria bacterium]
MNKTPERWNSYFVNVNGKLASITLNLALREHAPVSTNPQLLWVWVYMRTPRPDGLSDRAEFDSLSAIEDELTLRLSSACNAIPAGRITTDGHREFYFYGSSDKGFESAVHKAMSKFSQYKFDLGSQKDAEWNQYLNVLYPSDEDLEKMKNQDVLDVMEKRGDNLEAVRDVYHWIYFVSKEDRQAFAVKVRDLGYKIERESEMHDEKRPFGLQITRAQSITAEKIDAAVIELFKLAKQVNAEYDGWEAQVVGPKK